MSNEKKRYIKVPPELVDGQNWTVMEPDSQDLLRTLSDWAENGDVGDGADLEIVEMTQEQIDALPDI